MRYGLFITLLLCGAVFSAAQQRDPDIQPYMDRINAGNAADVRAELPSMLSKYPNNPAILYLQGLLATEGAEAVRVFQSIVDNFPQSEWADDALYRVYQFYYALGLYRTAELKMNQLRRDYPASRYLSGPATGDVGTLADEVPDTSTASHAAAPGVPPVAPPSATAGRTPPPPETVSPVPPEEFQLQAGAFTALANAERQKVALEGLGYAVEIRVKVTERRSLYTVLAGRYATSDEARAAAAELKRVHGIDAIVVRP